MSAGVLVTIPELQAVDLFAGIPEDGLKQVAKFCHQRYYKPGEYCVAQGETTNELYIVKDGKVGIEMRIDSAPYNQTLNVATLGKGRLFAWSALVQPHVLTASVKCLEKTQIISIKASDLQKVFSEQPSVEAGVMRNLAGVISSRLIESRAQLLRLIGEMVKQVKY